jgi:hypothetical protein
MLSTEPSVRHPLSKVHDYKEYTVIVDLNDRARHENDGPSTSADLNAKDSEELGVEEIRAQQLRARIEAQLVSWARLSRSWEKMTPEEIEDIYRARTGGREVDL